ncbi:PorV/PorQ family protein [Candidatus Zixiibacteriota bacterium]
MKKYIIILLFIVIGFSLNLYADDGDGGYAAAFLQVPIGARPAAMGGAYISIANDGAGVYYNPAGIGNLKQSMFASSYRSMGLDRSLSYVSFFIPTRKSSALGFNWLYAGSGSVAARNSDGDMLGFDVTQNNHAFSVVFAKRFEKIISAGFKATYLHTTFAEMSSFSVAFDLGFTFYLSQLFNREKRDMMAIQDIQAGLVIRNLAGTYRWNNEKYYLEYASDVFGSEQEDKVPFEIGMGSSARFFDRKLMLALDMIKNQYQGFKLRSGAEYLVTPQLALRSGIASKQISAGAGFIFNLGEKVLAIDYAFATDKVDEGSEHIFSFDLLF